MRPVQTLRRTHQMARLVLAWMLLSLGVAVASPLIQPKNLQVVCSAAGAIKLVVQGDGSTLGLGTPGMDCPLCVGAGAPPPAPAVVAAPAAAPVPAPPWVLRAPVTAFVGHGWLARAPPAIA